MTTRIASCSCGAVKAAAEGDPVRISMCHCYACQKRTGSVFGAQARFPKDKVILEGNTTVYERVGDSGNSVFFHFCPQCGATVYYKIRDLPDVIAIPIGAFADSTFPTPRVSVYEARKHPWVHVPENAEHYD
ncbi:MAG: GFA family protein [Polyangiaceae bacterium]|nr:GFA family protein [Polyangiaceae bacterium]